MCFAKHTPLVTSTEEEFVFPLSSSHCSALCVCLTHCFYGPLLLLQREGYSPASFLNKVYFSFFQTESGMKASFVEHKHELKYPVQPHYRESLLFNNFILTNYISFTFTHFYKASAPPLKNNNNSASLLCLLFKCKYMFTE